MSGTAHTEGRLERVLRAGGFAVTAEIAPPLSGAADALLAKAMPLKGLADAVNVTDGASARITMSAAAAAAILVREGIEPVQQFTCRDRNRIALQADLLGGAALGVRNMLFLTGDDVKAGDCPDAKPVFDLKSQELIALAAQMRAKGKIASGRDITAPPKLFLGAADAPVDPKPDWKPASLKSKVDAGADFAQTQFCFDAGVVRRYMKRLEDDGLGGKIFFLIGIGPIANPRSAKWMRENLFGTIIPDSVIERLEKANDPKAEGVKICAELAAEFAQIRGVNGVHIMAPRNDEAVPRVIEACAALRKPVLSKLGYA
jgi:methylenetetrahydrofolate reductase (NADPH)